MKIRIPCLMLLIVSSLILGGCAMHPRYIPPTTGPRALLQNSNSIGLFHRTSLAIYSNAYKCTGIRDLSNKENTYTNIPANKLVTVQAYTSIANNSCDDMVASFIPKPKNKYKVSYKQTSGFFCTMRIYNVTQQRYVKFIKRKTAFALFNNNPACDDAIAKVHKAS